MNRDLWEFWIDVGGTFTDCFARSPDGNLRRWKLLSTGVTIGSVGEHSTAGAIIDSARRTDPAKFWTGAKLALRDTSGRVLAESIIVEFDAGTGTIQLQPALSVPPTVGQSYEISTGETSPVLGIRYLLGLPLGESFPAAQVRLGTTRGTNALITRRGARTAFITTRGFGDVLHIGYQNRPKLFELNIRKPVPLFCAVVEIDERVTATGEILVTPNPLAIRAQLLQLRSQNIESLAICLLHGSADPAHENLVAEIASEVGFEEISVSHRVAPLVKIVPRGDTTVLDGYLNPVLRRYVNALQTAMPRCDLQIVTSSGAMLPADRFSGKDSILSGPAAGVVGFSRVAEAAGFSRAIGFDMGGTSTDVSRFDGRYEMEYETEKAGVRVVAPMMAIETVAAGGGSICAFDGVKLTVGPDSAGADPGPACYGRGGPLTVTDVNFYLGRIQADRFPFPLDRAAVEIKLQRLADEIVAATPVRYQLEELAEGLLRVANANMVQAIRAVSIAKGCDPREYVLVPFGGAAGQHACAVAEELGIGQILHHPDAGLLSAYGIGMADHVRHRALGVYQPYSAEAIAKLEPALKRLESDVIAELERDFPDLAIPHNQLAGATGKIEIRRRLDLRYQGLDAHLTVDEPSDKDYAVAYEAEHRKLYGFIYSGRPLEIVAARIEVIKRSEYSLRKPIPTPVQANTEQTPERTVMVYFNGAHRPTQVYERDNLRVGQTIAGPAIVHEFASTTVVDPGWSGTVLAGGSILVEISDLHSGHHQEQRGRTIDTADPAMLEIFNNRFVGIAEQMGIVLRNTASSVNVKERLDFSCALFTARGELIANAPHIPVHLGAMGETVRCLLADHPDMQPGDAFVTNDPYRGGSHLPDITVVTPVFGKREMGNEEWGMGNEESESSFCLLPSAFCHCDLLFFTASRAHHAEIGGITPGSMPPFSKNLAEEGVLIRDFKLVHGGKQRFDELRELLLAGPHPTRAVNDNLADVTAQLAANFYGARELHTLIDRFTLPVVQSAVRDVQKAAETKLRRALAKLPPGKREFTDHLDDGAAIKATLTVHSSSQIPRAALTALSIDFTGTGSVMSNNLNANRAIVTAAVMYVLRLLIDEDIPLNEGILAPIELILPPCLLNPPRSETAELCAAVVGGNVETSQRTVDVLLGALDLAAASQGTMNNLLFGDATFGYYETICGGAGATPLANGADAVHTHMTNTRLTDPEVLERRYPVRLREFSIRRGSGGRGKHRGGDGVVRRIEFLRPLEVSILSQRRGPHPPYGLTDGLPGSFGRNSLTRNNGQAEVLAGRAQFFVEPGDVLTIETPGGGGWGTPLNSESRSV
jgi:5-oxoprolinase (ATP-hydrolysing)